MKNRYSLLLSFLIISHLGQAKTTSVSVPNIFPHYGSGGTVIAPGLINSRIIGVTSLIYNGADHMPVDSTTYAYSYSRGGQLSSEMDDNFINFDESYTYLYNPSLASYRNQFHRSQVFNQANKAQTFTCQSWKTANGTWRDSARYLYAYNGDLSKLLVTKFQISSGGNWADHVKYENEYDAQDNIIKMNSTVFKMDFSYDAANNLVQRLDSVWSLAIGFHPEDRYTFAYDASGKMIAYTKEIFSNNAWMNEEKFELTYTINDVTEINEYIWDNNSWSVRGKHLFLYDANHNKLSDEYKYWDDATGTFISATLLQWTYNNFNQPVSYYSQTWEPATNSWNYTTDDFLYRYYYQTYSTTAIDSVAYNIDMNLYPQPASQYLNVNISFKKSEIYSVFIFDAQGRVLKQINGSDNSFKEKIALNEFAAGNYYLKVTTGDQQISRQFVVIH